MIGPNGGGKTTLVNDPQGTPYSGEVQYSPVGSDGYGAIGYHRYPTWSESLSISVCEVVLSGLQACRQLFGRCSAADKAKAFATADLCGIRSIARRPIGRALRRPVATYVALPSLISTEVLILDEPANFVDNKFERS
ncbi:MAG: hypothetical protein ACLR8Y_18820 [Alistipes indistinctus]